MPEVPLRNVIQETFDSVADGYDSPALFARAGLCDVRVELKNAGYYLTGEHQWWDIIWNAGYRRLVSQLAPAELARFLRESIWRKWRHWRPETGSGSTWECCSPSGRGCKKRG